MCGIHASISRTGYQSPSSDLKLLLRNRGPDHFGAAQATLNIDEEPVFLSFTSTVLALRGGHVQSQPFVDDGTGSVLCWNGEAWRIGSEPVAGNDGQRVFDSLLEASALGPPSHSNNPFLDVFRSISGPFAFVFFDKMHSCIYFGRDRLGRRSLLYNTESVPGYIEFASTSDPGSHSWKEVEADTIYQLSCTVNCTSQSYSEHPLMAAFLPVQRYPWVQSNLKSSFSFTGRFNRSVPSKANALNTHSPSVKLLKNHLFESMKLRILNVPPPPALNELHNVRIAILFSGGLDCTVLACIAHEILSLDQQIDLINVAFQNPRVVAASKVGPKTKIREKRSAAGAQNASETVTDQANAIETSPYEACPDRVTGRKSFQELQDVCIGRVWRFVTVNIPYTETVAHRDEVLKLIYPHNTEMDLSIAYALYFAARGNGTAISNLDHNPSTYTTPARVLLSGLGADELFGGYTRHATAFNRNGFTGLFDELELDVSRLGKRNLGRDDRIISHWGREARYPYLEESLVKWAVECPIWEKCGFDTTASSETETPNIEPGKKVLRLLANELGMQFVAHEKKRAIQFGARTAKMEVGRTKGTALVA